MWLALLSMHLLGNVGYNLLLRKSVLAKVDKWLLAAILQTGICVPALILLIFVRIQIPVVGLFDIVLLVSAVMLTIVLQALNVKVLQYLEASVYSVIYNTRVLILTVLGAVLLSESISPLSLIGGLLIFTSVFLVKQETERQVTKIGLLYGFSSAFVISFLNITEKLLNQRLGFFEYFIPVTIVCTIILWTIVFVRRTKISISLIRKPSNVFLMVFRAMSAFGFSAAIIYGPVAVSNYISSLSVILIIICGVLFLGEKDYLKSKIIAAVVAFAGLTLILLARF